MHRIFLMSVSSVVGCMVLLMLWWPSLVYYPMLQNPDSRDLDGLWNDMTKMVAPHHVFETLTMTYDLRADSIVLGNDAQSYIVAEALYIKAADRGEERFVLQAVTGQYDRNTRQLHLLNGVKFRDVRGREWRTDKAVLLLEERILRGDEPVEAMWGERMNVLANQGFYLNDRTDEWRLLGATEMRFDTTVKEEG